MNTHRLDEQVTGDLDRPFAVAGRRAYLIGHMNGRFPDLGHHLPGEMGGLWAPPLKLADGFWFGLREQTAPGDGPDGTCWLGADNCRQFTMTPGGAERVFAVTVGGHALEVRQRLCVPEQEPGLLITLTVANHSAAPVTLALAWLTRFDIQGAWWSGWPDRPDEALVDWAGGAITGYDSLTPGWAAAMVANHSPVGAEAGADLWANEQTSSLDGTWGAEHGGIIDNPTELQGGGMSGMLVYEITLPALLLSAADGDRPAQRTAAGVAGVGLLLALAGQFFHVPSFNPAALAGAPPDKTLVGVLQNPQMQAHITDTVWGPFARLDLVETSDPDTKLLFTDGGAGSYMIRFDGDYSKVADLQQDPDYLPFTVAPPTSTLILGAGAGKDVLLALMAGSQQVTAVELNQDSVDLTRRYGAYNGQILDRPGVTTVVSDGRSFVESTQQHYDLIYLNLVYSQAAGHEGSALAESYVFTVEALRAYWQHLKPGGRIGIVTHNGFEGSRVLLTAIAALQAEGLDTRQALDRVILHQQVSQNPDSATSVLLVTKNALDETQLSAQIGVADKLGMRQMYVPVLFELPLRDLVKGVATLDTFAHNGEYNLVPTHDEQPYFYQLQWGLPAAIVLLLILTGLGAVIYLTVVVRLNWRAGARPAVALALFFVLLGAAYMLAMLPLVQRFYLLVGNPTLALVITLEGLLFGAGFGSLFSSRLHGNLKRPVTLALAGAFVLLVAYAVLYPLFGPALLQTPLLVRLGAILLMTLPLGLLIGLPFPSGLRLAGAWAPRAVPALWGLNAIAAVLGSVLAAAVAMLLGFEAVLLLAACCYAAAAVLLRGVRT